MSGQYYFLLFLVPVLGYFYYRTFKSRKAFEVQNDHARVGSIAERLKLKIIQGDPNFNLVVTKRTDPFAPKEVNVLLRGTPYQHPIEIVYHDKRWIEEGFTSRTHYQEFEGKITLSTSVGFSAFEILSKQSTVGTTPQQRLRAKEQLFADPLLDQAFTLRTDDPGMGKTLAPVLHSLLTTGPFATMPVQLLGKESTLTFFMTEIGMMGVMGQVDQWVHALESLGCALEGKPVPALLQEGSTLPQAATGFAVASSGATTSTNEGLPQSVTSESIGSSPMGSTQTSSVQRGAVQSQVPIPCKTCGAPMKEMVPANVLEPVKVRCDYCHASETLPGDQGERAKALRTRLFQMKWAEDAAKGPALAMAQVTEKGYWIAVILFLSLFLGFQIFQQYQERTRLVERIATLPREVQEQTIKGATTPFGGFSIGAMTGVMLGCIAMWVTYRKAVRPTLLARAPLHPNQPMRCRHCGGDLPQQTLGAFISCRFCQAQNLVTNDIARNQAALLEKEIKEYRQRAAEGTKKMNKVAQNALVLFYAATGVGMVLGIIFGYILNLVLFSSLGF